MRIGITGGAGYIATHLAWELLGQGHELQVIDNLSSGSPGNIITNHKNYHFLKGDISSDSDLSEFFRFEPEVIFHFAALKAAGESMEKPETYSAVNIRYALKMLEKVPQGCVVVFSSSAAVYGAPRSLPMSESHPLQPENYYGFTKKVIEENLEWFSRLRKVNYAALRYFNAVGYDPAGRVGGIEKSSANLLPIIMDVVTGKRKSVEIYGTDYETRDGTCIRDYIHVMDLVDAHIRAMHYIIEKKTDLVINLGSQNGSTVKEMLEVARRITGHPIPAKEVERRPGDPAVLLSNSALARELIEWEPRFSDLETIITTMWKQYQSKA